MNKNRPPRILEEMAETFRERNKVYGSNCEMVGSVMQALFPNGVVLRTPEEFERWHLFELKIVKLTRFVISGLTHVDSIHDDGVYSSMVESLVEQGGVTRIAGPVEKGLPLFEAEKSVQRICACADCGSWLNNNCLDQEGMVGPSETDFCSKFKQRNHV